jgi:hypothetical protein
MKTEIFNQTSPVIRRNFLLNRPFVMYQYMVETVYDDLIERSYWNSSKVYKQDKIVAIFIVYPSVKKTLSNDQ